MSDAAAVEALLSNLGARGPREPTAWEVLDRAGLAQTWYGMHGQVRRVRARFAVWVTEHGRPCIACGEQFKSGRGYQRRCPGCIRGGAK